MRNAPQRDRLLPVPDNHVRTYRKVPWRGPRRRGRPAAPPSPCSPTAARSSAAPAGTRHWPPSRPDLPTVTSQWHMFDDRSHFPLRIATDKTTKGMIPALPVKRAAFRARRLQRRRMSRDYARPEQKLDRNDQFRMDDSRGRLQCTGWAGPIACCVAMVRRRREEVATGRRGTGV